MKSVIIMKPIAAAAAAAAAAPTSAPDPATDGSDAVKGKSISKIFQWQNVEAGSKKHLGKMFEKIR